MIGAYNKQSTHASAQCTSTVVRRVAGTSLVPLTRLCSRTGKGHTLQLHPCLSEKDHQPLPRSVCVFLRLDIPSWYALAGCQKCRRHRSLLLQPALALPHGSKTYTTTTWLNRKSARGCGYPEALCSTLLVLWHGNDAQRRASPWHRAGGMCARANNLSLAP